MQSARIEYNKIQTGGDSGTKKKVLRSSSEGCFVWQQNTASKVQPTESSAACREQQGPRGSLAAESLSPC